MIEFVTSFFVFQRNPGSTEVVFSLPGTPWVWHDYIKVNSLISLLQLTNKLLMGSWAFCWTKMSECWKANSCGILLTNSLAMPITWFNMSSYCIQQSCEVTKSTPHPPPPTSNLQPPSLTQMDETRHGYMNNFQENLSCHNNTYLYGLVKDVCNSIANTLELLKYGIKPSLSKHYQVIKCKLLWFVTHVINQSKSLTTTQGLDSQCQLWHRMR